MEFLIKNLLLFIVLMTVLTSKSFAGIKPSLVDGSDYPLDYKVVEFNAVCPQNGNDLPCKAAGSEITLEANYKNCGDQVKSFDYTTYMYDGKLNIEIESTAVANPFADRAHCLKQAKFIHTITVLNEDIEGINIQNIHTHYAR